MNRPIFLVIALAITHSIGRTNSENASGIANLEQRVSMLEEELHENEKETTLEFCALGMKSHEIQDLAISASSRLDELSGKRWARLDQEPIKGESSGSWCAHPGDDNKWIYVDLGRSTEISGIITQGSPTANRWTRSYELACGDSDGKFTHVTEYGASKTFRGNSDRNTKAVNFFAEKLLCRYVRVHPTSWTGQACMRLEILRGACSYPKKNKFYVSSAGYDDGNLCEVQINGINRAISRRGHCVVIFDPATYAINAKTFDTYLSVSQTNAMVNFINSARKYSIISIAIRDATNPEYITGQATKLLEKLGAVGTECPVKVGFRDSWAFVTQKVGDRDLRPPLAKCQYVRRYHGTAVAQATVPTSVHYGSIEDSPIG